MTSRPRHATPVTSLGALVGAFLAACGGPPPTVTTCLTRDDCGSVEICLGGRCVVPTIDAASGDSGRTVDSGPVDSGTVDAPIPDVGVLVDSGRPPPDAFSEVDDASAPGDASGPLPTASGHLFVLTGGTQRILSFAIAPDGAPSETGALDVYHPGRAIIARPDGNGLYIWAASAGPMASLETFAVSGDSAVGPGYTLDIGGGSLPVAAPLAHTPDGRFVYGGYVMGGGSIAQLQSGVGSFGTLTPFTVAVSGAPGGAAVASTSDRLFVSIPETGLIIDHIVMTDGTLRASTVSSLPSCVPGPLAANPSLARLYVGCTSAATLITASFLADGLSFGAPFALAGSPDSLVLTRDGRTLVAVSIGSEAIDVFEILPTGELSVLGRTTLPGIRAVAFDASGSRLYGLTATMLTEYALRRSPLTLTAETSRDLSATDGVAIVSTR